MPRINNLDLANSVQRLKGLREEAKSASLLRKASMADEAAEVSLTVIEELVARELERGEQ